MATTPSDFEPLTGHCTCKTITYTLSAAPMVTHCCHCTWCQRETGTAFVLNAIIECYNFSVTSPTKPVLVSAPAPSGVDQLFARCPTCSIAVYSHYGGQKQYMFLKVGTLADGHRQKVKPDVHIYTSTKMEWVDLEKEKERGIKVYEEYYSNKEEVWSKEALQRRGKMIEWLAEEEKKKGQAAVEG